MKARTASRAGRQGKGRERGRSGDKPERGSKRARRDEAEPTAEAQPVEMAAEVQEAKTSRRDAIKSENAERKGRPEREQRGGNWRQDDNDPAPVGFGEDIPAFMKIPARV